MLNCRNCGLSWAPIKSGDLACPRCEVTDVLIRVAGVALRWLGDPDDPTGTFEDIGIWYQAETGRLRPGKSMPIEMGPVDDDERERHFRAWADQKGRTVRDLLRTVVKGPIP